MVDILQLFRITRQFGAFPQFNLLLTIRLLSFCTLNIPEEFRVALYKDGCGRGVIK
jgi:hypothetical protein